MLIENKEQKEILTPTKAFEAIMQACSESIEHREEWETAGMLTPSSSADEAIGVLFANWMFFQFEKTFSPSMAMMFVRIYCRQQITSTVNDTLLSLGKKDGVNLVLNKQSMVFLIDVYNYATRGKNIGYQKHWNPFKEPFFSLWEAGFDGEHPFEQLISQATQKINEHVLAKS